MSTRADLYKSRRRWMIRHSPYSFLYYKYFDFAILNNVMYLRRAGKGKNGPSYNDCIIMVDTETSKEKEKTVCKNYVVAWTLSILAFDMPIVTLYGTKPSELVTSINNIIMAMQG